MNPERQSKIIAMRNGGANLQEIADEVNLTRERVRQLLASEGMKTFRHPDRLAQAIAEWRESGELRRPYDVAIAHGLAPNGGNLAALRRGCPDLTLPDEKKSGSQWNREGVAVILARIAEEQGIDPATGWMRMSDYEKWLQPGDPSIATIGANYLWSDLMRLAGFNPDNASRRGRQPGIGFKEFTEDELDEAVRQYLASKPDKLSAKSMEAFFAENEGMPSIATVRNRFRKRGIGSISGIIQRVSTLP